MGLGRGAATWKRTKQAHRALLQADQAASGASSPCRLWLPCRQHLAAGIAGLSACHARLFRGEAVAADPALADPGQGRQIGHNETVVALRELHVGKGRACRKHQQSDNPGSKTAPHPVGTSPSAAANRQAGQQASTPAIKPLGRPNCSANHSRAHTTPTSWPCLHLEVSLLKVQPDSSASPPLHRTAVIMMGSLPGPKEPPGRALPVRDRPSFPHTTPAAASLKPLAPHTVPQRPPILTCTKGRQDRVWAALRGGASMALMMRRRCFRQRNPPWADTHSMGGSDHSPPGGL